MNANQSAAKTPRKLEGQTVFASAEVRRVERLIDSSGIVAVLDPMLPAGGRTRDLSLRTLLVGLGLTAAGNATLYLKTVHAGPHRPTVRHPASTRRHLD